MQNVSELISGQIEKVLDTLDLENPFSIETVSNKLQQISKGKKNADVIKAILDWAEKNIKNTKKPLFALTRTKFCRNNLEGWKNSGSLEGLALFALLTFNTEQILKIPAFEEAIQKISGYDQIKASVSLTYELLDFLRGFQDINLANANYLSFLALSIQFDEPAYENFYVNLSGFSFKPDSYKENSINILKKLFQYGIVNLQNVVFSTNSTAPHSKYYCFSPSNLSNINFYHATFHFPYMNQLKGANFCGAILKVPSYELLISDINPAFAEANALYELYLATFNFVNKDRKGINSIIDIAKKACEKEIEKMKDISSLFSLFQKIIVAKTSILRTQVSGISFFTSVNHERTETYDDVLMTIGEKIVKMKDPYEISDEELPMLENIKNIMQEGPPYTDERSLLAGQFEALITEVKNKNTFSIAESVTEPRDFIYPVTMF